MFNFRYYICWPVGIAFFGLYNFRYFLNFLSFLLFKPACLRQMAFPFTFLAYYIVSRAFVIWIPIWGVTISAISVFVSLFRSCPAFSCICYFMYMWIFLMSFSCMDIRASGMVFFLFIRSFVFCWICSVTLGTSKPFSFISPLISCRWLMLCILI